MMTQYGATVAVADALFAQLAVAAAQAELLARQLRLLQPSQGEATPDEQAARAVVFPVVERPRKHFMDPKEEAPDGRSTEGHSSSTQGAAPGPAVRSVKEGDASG